MKKIHLDLGTHYGQGLNEFIRMLNIDKSWKIYSFEANPITYQKFLQSNTFEIATNNFDVSFQNKAVYTRNGKITFNLEHPDGMASTLINLNEWKPYDTTLYNNYHTSVDVECIDLSELVNSFDESEITCKMDIEGAEFDILDNMINNKSIHKIKTLWVEFHNNIFADKELYTNKKNNIISYLNNNNIEIHDWH
jgi:FkbM family methyltransferase